MIFKVRSKLGRGEMPDPTDKAFTVVYLCTPKQLSKVYIYLNPVHDYTAYSSSQVG